MRCETLPAAKVGRTQSRKNLRYGGTGVRGRSAGETLSVPLLPRMGREGEEGVGNFSNLQRQSGPTRSGAVLVCFAAIVSFRLDPTFGAAVSLLSLSRILCRSFCFTDNARKSSRNGRQHRAEFRRRPWLCFLSLPSPGLSRR